MEQKLDYLLVRQAGIHNNPIEAGYVTESFHWRYSSASDYTGIKGYVEIEKLQ